MGSENPRNTRVSGAGGETEGPRAQPGTPRPTLLSPGPHLLLHPPAKLPALLRPPDSIPARSLPLWFLHHCFSPSDAPTVRHHEGEPFPSPAGPRCPPLPGWLPLSPVWNYLSSAVVIRVLLRPHRLTHCSRIALSIVISIVVLPCEHLLTFLPSPG